MKRQADKRTFLSVIESMLETHVVVIVAVVVVVAAAAAAAAAAVVVVNCLTALAAKIRLSF